MLSQEGYAYRPDRLDHFFRQMCYNTGYADHVTEMVREIVSGADAQSLVSNLQKKFSDKTGKMAQEAESFLAELKKKGLVAE